MAVPVRTKTRRRQQIEQAMLYPLDWVEERSGIVGAVKYFLFRKVPGDISWAHTLGSASLTAFLVQAITGVILAMYYKASSWRCTTSRTRRRPTSRSSGSRTT
jgi:menaquinol-cytochrome c reductase cytochrome b subunit